MYQIILLRNITCSLFYIKCQYFQINYFWIFINSVITDFYWDICYYCSVYHLIYFCFELNFNWQIFLIPCFDNFSIFLHFQSWYAFKKVFLISFFSPEKCLPWNLIIYIFESINSFTSFSNPFQCANSNIFRILSCLALGLRKNFVKFPY